MKPLFGWLRTGRSRSIGAALVVLVLATLSFALWRAEVEFIKGWTGINWLRKGYPWSAPPICALVALSVLTPPAVVTPLSRWRAGVFLAVATIIGWVSFDNARDWFYLNIGWLTLLQVRPPPEYYVFSPLLSMVLTTVGMQQAIHRLLVPIATWTMVYFLAAILLIVPVSLLCLQIVPAHGEDDIYHTIKSGYTAFWTNILLAAAAALAIRFRRRAPQPSIEDARAPVDQAAKVRS